MKAFTQPPATPAEESEISTLSLNPDSRPTRGRKFYIALACYAAIAILAGFTLDGKFLWVVWIFLGWFAVRTYIETLKRP